MTLKNASEVIAAVMADVQGLAKRDRNQAQGFNFRGIDAVMNAVGPALRKHGGFIVPSIDQIEYATIPSKNGGQLNVARVMVTYLVHGQTGAPIAGSAAAEAFDSGDKATAKAMSVAYRTFLLQLLCLPTDEPDPDHFTYEVAETDWASEMAALKTKSDARKLWTRATANRAPEEILIAIKEHADQLPE